MRLSEVNAAAEPHGMHLPIDLGADPMIGGMIATNTGGARFLRHGDMRRRTLGLTVVLPDAEGTVMTSSGLRKDNAGLDWKHLFIGTGGVFVLVTEAVVELAFLPRRTAAALLVPPDATAVPHLLVALERGFGATLNAFEMMSGPAIAAALDHVPSLRDPFPEGRPGMALLVEVAETGPAHDGAASLDETLQGTLAGLWETDPDLLEDAVFGPPAELWSLAPRDLGRGAPGGATGRLRPRLPARRGDGVPGGGACAARELRPGPRDLRLRARRRRRAAPEPRPAPGRGARTRLGGPSARPRRGHRP